MIKELAFETIAEVTTKMIYGTSDEETLAYIDGVVELTRQVEREEKMAKPVVYNYAKAEAKIAEQEQKIKELQGVIRILNLELQYLKENGSSMWFCDNDVDCDTCKERCNIWQKGYNTAKENGYDRQRKMSCVDCEWSEEADASEKMPYAIYCTLNNRLMNKGCDACVKFKEKNNTSEKSYENHCNMDCDNCEDKCPEWKMGYCEGFKKAKEEKPDTVEIVRCKDCIHRCKNGYCQVVENKPPEEFFCRKGEKE